MASFYNTRVVRWSSCRGVWTSAKSPNLQAIKGKSKLMVVSQFFLNVLIGMHVTLHNSYVICDAQVSHRCEGCCG